MSAGHMGDWGWRDSGLGIWGDNGLSKKVRMERGQSRDTGRQWWVFKVSKFIEYCLYGSCLSLGGDL